MMTTISSNATTVAMLSSRNVSSVSQTGVLDTDISYIKNVAFVFYIVVFGVVCQLIVMFGIVTNIINIACFVKQGFQDQINISLTGMAVSDLGILITFCWSSICQIPGFSDLDLPFHPAETQYLISAMPHLLFARISAWITAFVTLERCLCIALPFKIKHIITPARVSVIVVCIFIILIADLTPVYIVSRLDWKFFPDRNKTILGLLHMVNQNLVNATFDIFNNSFLPLFSFVFIIVCTITLALLLHYKMKFHVKATTDSTVSDRNKKVAKLVVILSLIFIICFAPNCVLFVSMSLFPDFSFTGHYKDIMLMIAGCGCVLECVNSSVNIFIYYRMSTKYRETFSKLVCFSRSPPTYYTSPIKITFSDPPSLPQQ